MNTPEEGVVPAALLVAYRDFALANSRLPLISALQEAGYHVVAAAECEGSQYTLRSAGVTVEPLPFRRGGFTLVGDAGAVWHLVRLMRRYRPTLVHLFNGKPVILGSAAALAFPGKKVVSTITGLGYDPGAGGFTAGGLGAGHRLVGWRSSAVIFQNADDRQEFVNRGWVRPRKAHLIVSSGVDTRRFNRSAPSRTVPKQGGTVLMVARLVRQKGVEGFLEAARRVRESHPEVEFVLGGEWSSHPDSIDMERIEKAVERDEVNFVGYVEDMPAQLSAVDIFVFPSFYREGVPRVLLEAAACGVPVIAADVPGSREVVREGRTGFLVPPHDPEALADAITHLLRKPVLRERMGRLASEMAVAEFDIEAVTRRQVDVYREIGVLPPAKPASHGK